MKTSKQLREEIGAKCDQVQAILDVAAADNRDLTAKEKADIDTIQGRGKPGDTGYVQGEIAELEEDLARVDKIEARAAELATARKTGAGDIHPGRAADPDDPPHERGDDETPRASRIKIPVQSRFRYGKLKAFTGAQAEQEAFLSGMFYLATIGQSPKAVTWCNEHGVDVRFRGALKEGSNELGGYLVPEETEQRIIDLREQYGVFRREAELVPMAGDVKNSPKRSGGVTAEFVGENEEIDTADKAWTNVKLIAKKIAAMLRFSTEISEDAIISIADDLTREIAWAFALKEDQCGFNGDGTSTYGGIVGVTNALAAGAIYTALAGNTGFETLDLVDFEGCIGKLAEYADMGNAKWYVSRAGWAASMMRLADAAGGNTTVDLASGPSRREFLGYPVVVSQVLNKTLGAEVSTIKAIFGDLRMGAKLGNRRGMAIAMSDQRYFELDQLAIRGTSRFDINVHERGTATEAGALVALKTPAA